MVGLKKNPFQGIKYREIPTHVDILTLSELKKIYHNNSLKKGMEYVRDVYVFCCYTGLAFIDVKCLRREHLSYDDEGILWLRKCREKNDNKARVPLLDAVPLALLKKYEENEDAKERGTCFPVYENRVMNDYLKTIAEICGVDKHLTTHTARHTFGSLRTAEGNAIQNVQKMMGHSSIKTTLRYVHIQDAAILNDMKKTKELRVI